MPNTANFCPGGILPCPLIIRCKKQREQQATCTCAVHFTPDLRCASGLCAALSEEFAGFPELRLQRMQEAGFRSWSAVAVTGAEFP